MTLVRRIARPMLASTFIIEGFNSFRHPATHVEAAKPLLEKVAPALGLPNDPELLIRVNGLAQLVGGLMLATGKLPRVGSVLLVGSIVPTTVAGHAFWAESDPKAKRVKQIGFVKNVSLLGGALLAAVDTAGKPGLAWRAANAGHVTKRETKHALKAAQREAAIARRDAQLKVQDVLN